ncbi:MAG TPA: prepilin-type N-terminal cleavage/methylation domain-containing protein [Pyrinomonadaceae bacterium]|jgi:prepilin-type N-terminal cleavage/methylation domain-containing protein
MKNQKNQKGFSLIELLIVVAIIGIIAAIAIPNLLASRRAANESSAISSCRTLVTSQMAFASSNGNGQYATNLAALNTAGYIDNVLSTGSKSGFDITAGADNAANPPTFFVSAKPTVPSGLTQTGARRFGAYQDGVIRVDTAGLTGHFTYATVQTASALQ